MATEEARLLLESSIQYEAHKYIAIAHRLFAGIAIAREDVAEAARELEAALAESQAYPMPLVAWKTYAALGRVRLRAGAKQAAREAFAQAATIARAIAANTNDERLRKTFLNSMSVRQIIDESNE